MSANNSNNLGVQVDDLPPPPPYTETDIYSNPGSRSPHSAVTSSNSVGAGGGVDDNASRVSSSTSAGDIIYTPPETPRTSHAATQQQVEYHPGAALYFDSRPPPPLDVPDTLVHVVRVQHRSLPDDFPYDNNWAGRDVSSQDWATFINYLLPDHTTRGNDAVIDRKLRAEDQSESASSRRGPRSHAEAQLEHIRDAAAAESPADAAQRRTAAEATVQQWNDGFFGPRGVSVQLDRSSHQPRMPGSWDSSFDVRGTQRGREVPAEGGVPSQQYGGRTGSSGGLEMGPDGIRWGKRLVADSNGLRIGNLIMDHSGIRMGQGDEQPGSRGGPFSGRGIFAGAGAGAGRGAFPFGGHSHGHQHSREHHQHDHEGQSHGHHRGGGRRGRHVHDHTKTRRDRSSSVSSISSISSSDSASSIGSLPEYDEIKDQQLPMYISRLQDWTANPDHVRTKNDVKGLKAELREQKRAPANEVIDKKALKAQLKVLTGQWKQMKRQQKRRRREQKRERRQRRRAEKQERRENKRELKRAHREARRGRGPPPDVPSVPSIPGIPGVPGVPGASTPHASHAHPVPPSQPAHPAQGRGFWEGMQACQSGGASYGGNCGPRRGLFGNSGGLFGQARSWGPPGGSGPCGPGRRDWPGAGEQSAVPNFTPRRPVPRGMGGPTEAPGAWPEDKRNAAPEEPELPPPSGVAAAKYQAAADIERALEQTTAALAKVGSEKGAGMDKQLVALRQQLERMRMEADEAYVCELTAAER